VRPARVKHPAAEKDKAHGGRHQIGDHQDGEFK
jgi:hypothetical protein